MKYFGIYTIINNQNQKFYIGSTGHLNIRSIVENKKWADLNYFPKLSREEFSKKISNKHKNVGIENINAKLSELNISKIKELSKSGFSQTKISKLFNVSQGTIWKVLNSYNWTHLMENN